jgi:hypothetical protein
MTSWLKRAGDLLFGYDFFISYAHSDGEPYVKALADRLKEKGFRVFLDSRVYVAGDDLRLATERRVRMSKYLLVVVRPHALDSAWVLTELKVSINAGRTPIAISVNHTLQRAPEENALRQLLADKVYIDEIVESGKDEPHSDTVGKILVSFKATRQDLVRSRAVAAALIVLFTAGAMAGWQYLLAQRRAEQARDQRALRYVADADRQLFQSPQQAVLLAAQGLAAGPTDMTRTAAQGAVERALQVIAKRQAVQKQANWGSNPLQSYIAGEWFEADLAARYSKNGQQMLVTTERGASGPNPPGEALLVNPETLQTTLLDLGPAWGTSPYDHLATGLLASFQVRSDAANTEIPFACSVHPDERGSLAIGMGGADIEVSIGGDDFAHWSATGTPASFDRKTRVNPGATVSFALTSGTHGLVFLDKEQMFNLLQRKDPGPALDYQPSIASRGDMKRRLEYVGFSESQRKIYLARQYNVEIYRLDGTLEKELRTGGGCTKYPISLVTGILDDRVVLYGDTDGGLYRLDPGSGHCESLSRRTGQIAIRMDSNLDGTLGAIVFKDRAAAVLQLGPEMSRRSLAFLPDTHVTTAVFSPTAGDQLLTAGDNGHVALWQVGEDPRELRVYPASGRPIGFAEYSEDGASIVAVDEENRLYVWNAASGALLEQRDLAAVK